MFGNYSLGTKYSELCIINLHGRWMELNKWGSLISGLKKQFNVQSTRILSSVRKSILSGTTRNVWQTVNHIKVGTVALFGLALSLLVLVIKNPKVSVSADHRPNIRQLWRLWLIAFFSIKVRLILVTIYFAHSLRKRIHLAQHAYSWSETFPIWSVPTKNNDTYKNRKGFLSSRERQGLYFYNLYVKLVMKGGSQKCRSKTQSSPHGKCPSGVQHQSLAQTCCTHVSTFVGHTYSLIRNAYILKYTIHSRDVMARKRGILKLEETKACERKHAKTFEFFLFKYISVPQPAVWSFNFNFGYSSWPEAHQSVSRAMR